MKTDGEAEEVYMLKQLSSAKDMWAIFLSNENVQECVHLCVYVLVEYVFGAVAVCMNESVFMCVFVCVYMTPCICVCELDLYIYVCWSMYVYM